MSASTIADNLVTMLSAASAFGTGGVAKDYSVMESTSGSCAVVEFLALDNTEDTFGNQLSQANWTFSIKGYSKDLGQPQATLNRVLSIVDIVHGTLKADRTLLGSVEQVTSIRAQRELPPAGAVEAGGSTWLEILFEIDCYTFPDG